MDQEVVRVHPIWKEVRSGLKSGGPYGLGKYGTFDGNDFGDHIKSLVASRPTNQSHSSTRRPVRMATYWIQTALTGCSRCRWIRMSSWFIPEVIWCAGTRTTLLERLYNMMFEGFDCSTRCPAVIPKLRNKTYLSAKSTTSRSSASASIMN